jgi:hypothetical protein
VASNNNYSPENLDSRVTFDALEGTDYVFAVATTPGGAGAAGVDVHYGRPPSQALN